MDATDQLTNLHRLRRERGLTRRDLAAAAGITERQLARYELDGKSPKLSTAYLLAEALDVNVEAIA